MTFAVRLAVLACLVTFAVASCSGSHRGDKTKWSANSTHTQKHRGRR